MADAGSENSNPGAPPPKENPFVSLILNVVLPGLILTQLSKPERLGPLAALFVAISLPIGYGIYDAIRRKKLNFFSVVGFISTLLTGVLSFPKDPIWFASKEAVIPLVFAGALLASHKTKKPLIRMFLWNKDMLDTPTRQSAKSTTVTTAPPSTGSSSKAPSSSPPGSSFPP